MRRGLMPAFTLITLALGSAAASAQPAEGRWTIGATTGVAGTWDDEGSIGRGVIVGGYTQWRWLERTALEASADFVTHDRTGGHFEAHGHTTLIGASLVQYFGLGSVRGFATGGALVGAHSGNAGFPAENLVTTTSSTDLGYMFGGGLTFRTKSVQMGPLIKIVLMRADSDSDPASLAMAAFRVSFP